MVWESEPRTGTRIKGSHVLDIATMQLIFACVCHCLDGWDEQLEGPDKATKTCATTTRLVVVVIVSPPHVARKHLTQSPLTRTTTSPGFPIWTIRAQRVI